MILSMGFYSSSDLSYKLQDVTYSDTQETQASKVNKKAAESRAVFLIFLVTSFMFRILYHPGIIKSTKTNRSIQISSQESPCLRRDKENILLHFV
jgi:hypothetical protein